MANFGAGVNQQMTSAGTQAGIVGNQGSAFGNASMQQQMNANQQNAGNAFNWALNQANLNQNTNNTNANLQNSQWTTGVNGLLGLSGQQNGLGIAAMLEGIEALAGCGVGFGMHEGSSLKNAADTG